MVIPEQSDATFLSDPVPESAAEVTVQDTQTPAEQTGVGPEQAWPHMPQLLLAVFVSTSQPSETGSPQFAHPLLHEAMVHCPAPHPAVPCGMLHTWAHEPQLFGSVLPSVWQPMVVFPLQSRYPELQTKPQLLPAHTAVAFE
jgi:hypothetical protein